MISIIAYLAHQISIHNVPCEGDCDSNILRGLSQTKRNVTAVEFSDEITQAFIDLPTPEWAGLLDHGDYPGSYFLTFGCLVSSVSSVLLPDFASDKVIQFLAYNTVLSKADADFVYLEYLPQVQLALKDVKAKIPHDELVAFTRRFAGMLMKLAYAFAFQEQYPPIPFLWKPVPNEIGALLLPSWNKLASEISGVP